MKTKIKRHSRAVLSIILTLCMLVSCMTVGIIATDAAKVTNSDTAIGAKADSEDDALGAKDDSEALGLDSGDGIHLGIGTSTPTWHGMGSDAYEFTLNSTTTIYYTFSVGGSNFGKGNQDAPTSSSTESYNWQAIKNDNTQFSTSLPAGTYSFKLKGIQLGNANCLEYQFWQVSSGGGGGDEPAASDTIYFDKSKLTDWSTVYAYLYKSSYWDKTKGSGSSGRSNGVEMTYDSALGLYKTSIASDITHVVFLKDKQDGYTNFHKTEAVYIELSETYANDSKFSAATPVYVPDSSQDIQINSTRYYDTANTNHGSWVSATSPVAASLSISASPTELTAVDQTSTITVTATGLASGVNNLTYTIYDRANNDPVGNPVTVTNGETSATFTVTPNARVKSYYASVKPTTSEQQALYDEVWTSTDATITNSADQYIPRYTVTFSSNDNSYGTVTAKKADGTALTSGQTVKEGTSVTFTATPTAGNEFVEWDNFDTKATSVTRVIRAATTVQGKFGPKGYSIFYQSDTTAAMTEKSNGWYVSPKLPNGDTFTIKQNFSGKYLNAGGNNDYYKWNTGWMGPDHWDGISDSDWESTKFTTPNSKFYKNDTGKDVYCVYDPSTNRVWVTEDPDGLYEVHVVAKDGTIRYGYRNTADYTQVFGDTTVELVSPSSITGTVDNNAYDGMAVAYNLTANDVRNGVTLKIKTQTKSEYVSQGYYVKGFVVSGYEESFSVLWQEFVSSKRGAAEKDTYDDRAWIHSGYNEFELTINGYPEKGIEITPVYAKREVKSGDNIRFYVEGFAGEVYKEWGGTLAVDAFNVSGDRVFGEYPGQPMLNYNGRYVVDLPRTGVSGITLNNYVWDRIHSNLFYGTTGTGTGHEGTVKAVNYQTYDFNDFVYLKNKLDATHNEDEDIVFSFRHRTNDSYNTKETSQLGKSTYYKDSPNASQTKDYDYRKGFNTIDPSDSIYQWENLTDFYGNRVDIFSDYVDTKDSSGAPSNPKANYNPIRIVSNGYDYSEAGKYATAWAVYKPVDASRNLKYTGDFDHYELFEVYGGQGITTDPKHGSSSYLVDPRWTENLRWKYDQAYRTAHASEITSSTPSFVFDLAQVPTVISYEYQVQDGYSNLKLEGGNGEPAYRSDGRWFTTSSDQLLTAHTIIEYAERDEESLYHRDYYQGGGIDYTSSSGYDPTKNTGLATGIKAYFENDDTVPYMGQNHQNTSGNTQAYAMSDGDHEFLLKAEDDPNGEYVFKGWYMYTNGNYSLVSRSQTYPSEATANDVYVARYYKVPSGTLNINHSLTTDSRGEATCEVKAEILSSDGTTVLDNTSYPYTEGTLKIGSKYIKYYESSGNYIKITLKTTPGANTIFDKYQEKITKETFTDLVASTAQLGINATVAIDTTQTVKTATITFPINSLFDSSGDVPEQSVKSLPFFSKTHLPEYKYEITYNFGSRKLIQNGKLSNNRLWGDQFYKYKGTFTDEEVEQYLDLSGTPTFKSAETANYLAEHSPYEKNFLENTVWEFNGQTISYNASTLTFSCSLTATQTTNTNINVTFKLPFDYNLNTDTPNAYTFSVTKEKETDNPVYKDYKNVEQHGSVTMDFLDWFSLNGVKNKTQMTSENQPEFLKVPDVLYNNATNPTKKRTFKYWAFFKDGDDIDTAEPYQKCYSSALNQAVYQDTVFYPVYTAELEMSAEEIKEVASNKSATITFLGVTRDQWNYNGGNAANSIWGSKFADRIFTDFVLSFEYENKLIPTNNATFRTGLIIETLDTPAGGIANATPESLATKYASSDGKYEAITKIKNTASDISESGVGNYLISYNQQALDDRNAIEYYYGIANVSQSMNPTNDTYTTPTNRRNYGYRAYSFIKKGTGDSAEVIISDPVYFTIYNVASIRNGSEQVASGS